MQVHRFETESLEKMKQAAAAPDDSALLFWLGQAIVYALNNVAAAVRESTAAADRREGRRP